MRSLSVINFIKLSSLVTILLVLLVPQGFAEINDADSDGVADTVDQDDDNDGIPDRDELLPGGAERDSDRDGIPDRLDLDSDNDGILDVEESGVLLSVNFGGKRIVNGRLLAPVGDNGLADFIETFNDSSFISYGLQNTDQTDGDVLPDYLDLDSDNDGIPDLIEAGLPAEIDQNRDGRIDAPPGSVGADGILDAAQLNNDANCCDYDFDSIEDLTPLNTDFGDLPDFQDLDSDNDGFFDIVEAGGFDEDLDGRIDSFFDDANDPDGVDDAVMVVPLAIPDSNGDGIPDYRDINTQPGNPVATQSPDSATPGSATPGSGATDNPDTSSSSGGNSANPDADDGQGQEPVIAGAEPDASGSEGNGATGQSSGNPVAVLEDDALAGSFIETGLAGGTGCSIVTTRAGSTSDGIDPLLPLMLAMSLMFLLRQRIALCRHRVRGSACRV